MRPGAQERIAALLEVLDGERTSGFDDLKAPGRRATWSRFREHAQRVEWLDGLGDTASWVKGVTPAKAAGLAAQARVLSVGEVKDIALPRRTALVACLAAEARTQARDELVTMLCKRTARHLKRAQEEMEELERRHKALTEQLIRAYRDLLGALKDAPAEGGEPGTLDDAFTLARARAVVERCSGFDAQLENIEAITAHYGGNYTSLVERFFRVDRPTVFKLARLLTFVPTSTDHTVLDALRHALAHSNLTRTYIPDIVLPVTADGEPAEARRLDLSFASQNWLKTIYAKDKPGMLVRRHFEAMVFTFLVQELRCGDIAVTGSEEYGDWTSMLLPWQECEARLEEFCRQAGLPSSAAEFTAHIRQQLVDIAAEVDAGYPDNADLVIDETTGSPSLKARKGSERTASAIALDEELTRRLPERSILDALARAAHWTGWWRRFGPLSGSEPKLRDPLPRYVITSFTYGCNLGPAQAARHLLGGISAHELAAIAQRSYHHREPGARRGRRGRRVHEPGSGHRLG
jgi:hypothetical protein